MTKNPKVSIIIPCYNQGEFLQETIDSCLDQTYNDIEIIVVNDGSTDEYTNDFLKKYSNPKVTVINTQNQGPSSARNNGIMVASGKYILPLDADDKIAPTYVEKAITILEQNTNIGIVYCEAEYFGIKYGKWDLPEYSLKQMLNNNCIFCSALFKKTDWEKVGGYKKEMHFGIEDYEFWLSLIEQGAKVYRIPEVLFYYRQHGISRTSLLNENNEKIKLSTDSIFAFHRDFFEQNRNLLKKSNRLKFDKFCGKKMPFFYTEKTPTHKIYHIGKLIFSKRRKNKKNIKKFIIQIFFNF